MSSSCVSPLLPPQPLEVRSRNIDRQFIPVTIAIIMLALVALPISLPFLLFPGPYTVVGLLLLATLGFLTWFVIWRYRNVTAVRTVVDGRGLWLQQMKSSGRFIPWDNASGRITVKTVNQYTPGSPGPTTMSLVCLKLDQEELVLPGTVVTANSSSSAVQQSYTTAMRILAYDPWGQREPLMESTNTFAPQAPQATVIYNGYPGYPGYQSFG